MFNPNDPLFWVLVAFLAFVGLLIYYRVPTSVGKMLDDRADVIRKELDEARRLREDAQSLLADYQRKAREAEHRSADDHRTGEARSGGAGRRRRARRSPRASNAGRRSPKKRSRAPKLRR